MNEDIVDSLAGLLSFSLFFGYHMFYFCLIKTRPSQTSYGQNQSVRRNWVYATMSRGGASSPKDVIAVQTIRNGLMASSLLASTSITLSSAVAAFLLNSEKLDNIHRTALFGLHSGLGVHPLYKMFMLIFFFLSAFFAFMQSIRALTHASFAIGVPLDFERSFVDCEYVAALLQRGASFYTVGTRAFYAAFIVLLWLFGPVPPLVGSVLMIFSCWLLDIHHHKSFQRRTTASLLSSPVAAA